MAVAVLAPAAALRHVGLAGTWPWLARFLPSLGLPVFHSCTGFPDGPPGLKATFILGRLGEALLGHAVCTASLAAVLAVLLRPSMSPSRRLQRLGGVAVVSVIVSTAAFSAFVFAAVASLRAQDF